MNIFWLLFIFVSYYVLRVRLYYYRFCVSFLWADSTGPQAAEDITKALALAVRVVAIETAYARLRSSSYSLWR